MIRFSFTLVPLLFAGIIEAQNLSPTVVNSSGGVIQNSSHILEWSLGELAVATLTSTDNLLTQGFLQPEVSIVPTKDVFEESLFSAFPNPVRNELIFRTDLRDIATVSVHDAMGRLILQTAFQHSIDLQDLDSGMYVVSLFNTQNQLLHSFKINKIK